MVNTVEGPITDADVEAGIEHLLNCPLGSGCSDVDHPKAVAGLLRELYRREKVLLEMVDGYVVGNNSYLRRIVDTFATVLNLPRHTGACGNQNPLDPLGPYAGAGECYCQTIAQVPLNAQIMQVRHDLNERFATLEKRVTALEAPTLYGFGEANKQREDLLNTVDSQLPRHGADGVALMSTPHPVQEFPTIESLVEAVEKLFDCRDGYHGGWADGPTDCKPPEKLIAREPMRYRGIGAITRRTEDPFGFLRRALYTEFLNLRGQFVTGKSLSVNPILYWRYAKQIRIDEEREGRRHKIRTRIAIPDADWSRCELLNDGTTGYKEI